MRNEPFSGNFKPNDKPIWQIDLGFISDENQKNEFLGEKGRGLDTSTKRNGQSRELVPYSLIKCHLEGKAGFPGP